MGEGNWVVNRMHDSFVLSLTQHHHATWMTPMMRTDRFITHIITLVLCCAHTNFFQTLLGPAEPSDRR